MSWGDAEPSPRGKRGVPGLEVAAGELRKRAISGEQFVGRGFRVLGFARRWRTSRKIGPRTDSIVTQYSTTCASRRSTRCPGVGWPPRPTTLTRRCGAQVPWRDRSSARCELNGQAGPRRGGTDAAPHRSWVTAHRRGGGRRCSDHSTRLSRRPRLLGRQGHEEPRVSTRSSPTAFRRPAQCNVAQQALPRLGAREMPTDARTAGSWTLCRRGVAQRCEVAPPQEWSPDALKVCDCPSQVIRVSGRQPHAVVNSAATDTQSVLAV